MIINHWLDGGTAQTFQEWETGQEVYASFTEGSAAYAYARGTRLRQWTVKGVFLESDLSGWQTPSMGLFPAGSFRANKLRARQFEEFIGNKQNMACAIEWFAGGSVESEDQPTDGWYIITKFHSNYAEAFFGIITWDMEVLYVNPGNLRGHKLWWRGGALSTNFSQPAYNLLATPIDTTTPLAAITRKSFEGDIKLIDTPTLASNPFAFSSTTPNLLKGGVHVFDTTVDSTRPNATPPTTTLAHYPTWVEVFGSDHRFKGDMVFTNGILMCVIPTTQAVNKLMTVYWWDGVNLVWVNIGDIVWNDNTPTKGTLLSASLNTLGPETAEARLVAYTTTAEAEITIRLKRGETIGRIDLRPLTVDNSTGYALAWVPATAGWRTYNSTVNSAAASGSLAVATDYGFSAFYYVDAAKHWTAGWLYQNKPNSAMPIWSSTQVGIGDTTSPLVGNINSYAFFVTPDDDTELEQPDNTQADRSGPGDIARQFLHLKTVRVALG